jgi:cytochrome c oxidase subunit II
MSLTRCLLAISDMQSALNPAGEQGGSIARLWWIYFWVLTAIFVLVAIFLFLAMLPRRTRFAGQEPAGQVDPPNESSERRMSTFVIGAVIASIVVLFVLLGIDFFAGRSIYALNDQNTADADPLTIKITGHQWWWQVDYENQSEPSKAMTTANELHVPVGRPVKLTLQSSDVIHSFWVPNMHGKKDLVPGHPTEMWLKATRPGRFRGQCAEFCGLQHAHMRLTFVAESPERFEQWMHSASSHAPQPATDSQQRGLYVFMSNQCMMCHTITGTNARATVGPDLTHIGSRPMLAAGAIPNTRGYLAGWIANPQNIKPGVRMPPNTLPSDDLNALVDYLESLK